MNAKQKREYVIRYFQDEDLISDEAVDVTLKLINTGRLISKKEILEISLGKDYEEKMNYDTAYPQPYADRIADIYPDFRNGMYIYDYTDESYGKMVNIWNIFAKKMLSIFS